MEPQTIEQIRDDLELQEQRATQLAAELGDAEAAVARLRTALAVLEEYQAAEAEWNNDPGIQETVLAVLEAHNGQMKREEIIRAVSDRLKTEIGAKTISNALYLLLKKEKVEKGDLGHWRWAIPF